MNEVMLMIKVPEQYKHKYICCLPIKLELRVMKEVKSKIEMLSLTAKEKQEAIENACNEKLCNLTDTIQIVWT